MADSKPLEWPSLLRALASLEVWGGGYGLYAVVIALDNGGVRGLAGAGLLAIASVYYVISLVAGIQLARMRSWGVMLSRWVQAVQVVQLGISSALFAVWSGARLSAGMDDSGLSFHANLGSAFRVGWFASNPSLFVDINIIAVLALRELYGPLARKLVRCEQTSK